MMKKTLWMFSLVCMMSVHGHAGSIRDRIAAWNNMGNNNMMANPMSNNNAMPQNTGSGMGGMGTTQNMNAPQPQASFAPSGGSIKDRVNFFNAGAPSAPVQQETAPVTSALGQITQQCEMQVRAEAYNNIYQQCQAARETDAANRSNKEFNRFYAEYMKAAPKLAGLRNLGTYHPDPSQNQQQTMTSIDQVRNDGYGTLGRLNRNAPCEQFAEHMSIIHPANNGPFAQTMACISQGRGFQESEASPMPEPQNMDAGPDDMDAGPDDMNMPVDEENIQMNSSASDTPPSY